MFLIIGSSFPAFPSTPTLLLLAECHTYRGKDSWIKSPQQLQRPFWMGDFHQGFCLERYLERGSKSEARIFPNNVGMRACGSGINWHLVKWAPLRALHRHKYPEHWRGRHQSNKTECLCPQRGRHKEVPPVHTDSLGRIQFNLEVSFHGIKKSWLKRICWHHFALLFWVFLQSFFFPPQFWKLSREKLTQSSALDLAAEGIRWRCDLEPKGVCDWASPGSQGALLRGKAFSLWWKENRRWEHPGQNAKRSWNAVRWNRTWCCLEAPPLFMMVSQYHSLTISRGVEVQCLQERSTVVICCL